MKGLLGLALSGAVVVVVSRAVLRRARRAGTVASAPPVGESPGTREAPGPVDDATGDPDAGELPHAAGAPPDDAGALPHAVGALPHDAGSTDKPRATNRALRAMVALLVLFVCAGVAIGFTLPWTSHAHAHRPARRSGDGRHAPDPPRIETVTSVVPVGGTGGVAPNTTIAVSFSQPLLFGSPAPSLHPAVAGTWQLVGTYEMLFTPAASFVPSTTYTVTVPSGSSGVRASNGSVLTKPVAASFTIAPGSVLRLQQLLATLGYLPLAFSGPTPEPSEMALPQPGTFLWRDSGFPAQYTSLWSPARASALTDAAIMAFETQNGLDVDADGAAGPAVWSSLLADAAAGKRDGEPVTYVLVTKNLPEHLTVWVNGVLTFADVPCNTGVPGATTTDGTFEVFSHVQVSNMRGTDVTGTSYDVTVPWASYFDGGEALHGYPRASYGFPQSNGCVEMPIYTAGRVWPSTPIGTVVTVVGPPA